MTGTFNGYTPRGQFANLCKSAPTDGGFGNEQML